MKKEIIVGIDASRNRSGGAKAHIIGIMNALKGELPKGVIEIHLWSYPELLNALPNHSWLIKHSPSALNKSLYHQLKWQKYELPKEAKKNNINILLNTDAGTVCRFNPSITMSRDMLSYEKGEMKRFGLSLQRLRLIALKYVQNASLKNSTAAIFLTQYAADVIQKSCGKIENYKIVNHGVSDNFRIEKSAWKDAEKTNESIKCVYVSNVAPYKHQIHVAKAVKKLKDKGYNISIEFVGGGDGDSQVELKEYMETHDPNEIFMHQLNFIRHTELPKILSNKDLFIFASSCENMPNTLIEGMCTGLPIISSNRGPMPEVLENGGLYFDPEDSDSIAYAIELMITDENVRIEKSKKSLLLSKKYNWERCAKETFEFLIEIAKDK